MRSFFAEKLLTSPWVGKVYPSRTPTSSCRSPRRSCLGGVKKLLPQGACPGGRRVCRSRSWPGGVPLRIGGGRWLRHQAGHGLRPTPMGSAPTLPTLCWTQVSKWSWAEGGRQMACGAWPLPVAKPGRHSSHCPPAASTGGQGFLRGPGLGCRVLDLGVGRDPGSWRGAQVEG